MTKLPHPKFVFVIAYCVAFKTLGNGTVANRRVFKALRTVSPPGNILSHVFPLQQHSGIPLRVYLYEFFVIVLLLSSIATPFKTDKPKNFSAVRYKNKIQTDFPFFDVSLS